MFSYVQYTKADRMQLKNNFLITIKYVNVIRKSNVDKTAVFIADRTDGRAIGTVLCLSLSVVCLSVGAS